MSKAVNPVRALIERQTCCWRCHATGGWRATAKPAVRRNSTIHRLKCNRCGAEVIAKVVTTHVAGDARRRALAREHEALTKLQLLYPQDSQFKVVAPIDFWADGLRVVLITRYYPGDTAARYVRTHDSNHVRELYRMAGAWLRKLHDCATAQPASGPLGVADKLDYVRTHFAEAILHDRVMRTGYAALERAAAELATIELPFTRQHGDYKPENIIYDGTAVVGLDVAWQVVGATVYDVAQFLDHVWLGRPPGLHTLSMVRTTQLRAEAAFLRGYGMEPSMIGLRWAQLYFALCYCGRYEQRGTLAKLYGQLTARPLVRQLLCDL